MGFLPSIAPPNGLLAKHCPRAPQNQQGFIFVHRAVGIFVHSDLIEKHRSSELWAEFHALVVIGAEA